MPELTATVDRLRNAKCAAQKAHGEEVRRVEEEQRRSKAWRAQVDKVSLQVRCALLSGCFMRTCLDRGKE